MKKEVNWRDILCLSIWLPLPGKNWTLTPLFYPCSLSISCFFIHIKRVYLASRYEDGLMQLPNGPLVHQGQYCLTVDSLGLQQWSSGGKENHFGFRNMGSNVLETDHLSIVHLTWYCRTGSGSPGSQDRICSTKRGDLKASYKANCLKLPGFLRFHHLAL